MFRHRNTVLRGSVTIFLIKTFTAFNAWNGVLYLLSFVWTDCLRIARDGVLYLLSFVWTDFLRMVSDGVLYLLSFVWTDCLRMARDGVLYLLYFVWTGCLRMGRDGVLYLSFVWTDCLRMGCEGVHSYHELYFIVFYWVHLLADISNVRKCAVWVTSYRYSK